MNDSKNLPTINTSETAKSTAPAHPLRAWHIMYTILGVLIVALFVVGGLQLALYEMSPARGSTAGLAVAIFLLYGVIACVALGSAALFTLPFYIMARKRVVQSGAVAVPQKKYESESLPQSSSLVRLRRSWHSLLRRTLVFSLWFSPCIHARLLLK